MRTYKIQVITHEHVVSEQTLSVMAESPQQAVTTAENNRDSWRNCADCDEVKITATEEPVDAELEDLQYYIDKKPITLDYDDEAA
jgi:hypothetical protein